MIRHALRPASGGARTDSDTRARRARVGARHRLRQL